MQQRDPKSIIDLGPMGVAQWLAVIVTVGLNAMDGFDVLSISFASPGIAREWGVDKATLGWVLSMELLGMGVGSVLLGGVADKLGRRPTILGCLLAMTLGMFGAAHAADVPTLLAWRLLTGLGIGGMLAAINAAAAEFSNQRWRNLAMSFMVIGYPVGGVVGGLVVQHLLVAGAMCSPLAPGRPPCSFRSCGSWCPSPWLSSIASARAARCRPSIAPSAVLAMQRSRPSALRMRRACADR